jgi:CDGSH-type Zn-finger protein
MGPRLRGSFSWHRPVIAGSADGRQKAGRRVTARVTGSMKGRLRMTGWQANDATTWITPYQDGPLIVRGDFVIQAQDGTPIPAGRKTVALCRCGRSALKPFCDGSHARTGFRAASGSEAALSTAQDR